MNSTETKNLITNATNIIGKIKNHKKYNKKYLGKFPSAKTLRENPLANLPIIVEQMQLIVDLLTDHPHKPSLLGIWTEKDDLVNLLDQIIDEISELETELQEAIATKRVIFGQTVIPGHTLFTLARSTLLKATYNHIELQGQKQVIDSFSVIFLLRLSIESKLSTMMGFKSIKTINPNGSKFSSDHFPAGPAFTFLKEYGDSYFLLPISFAELKKIYDWSCRFVHSGRKEYIWMTLKAIDYVEKLFVGHSGTGFSGSRISNLKEGVSIDNLQDKLNNLFSKPNSPHAPILIWELSNDVHDITHSFWDTRPA
ncbi:hypothetical protein [Burkholderia sp. 3C]